VTEDALALALALRRLPSVGRVTTTRLLALAPTLDALRAIPREQVLLRLRGTPHAADLVRTLHDDAAMVPVLTEARHEADALARRGVAVHAPNLPGWPSSLERLERRDRPALLFSYGHAGMLTMPGVAFFGAPGLAPAAFEHAQALLPALVTHGLVPVIALATAFDVVMAKVAGGVPVPSVAVFGCGLGRVPPAMRPHALTVTRAGGAMVSPFEMEHGPFPHDEAERVRVQVALARAVLVFGATPGSPEAQALRDARALGIPAFTPEGLTDETPTPFTNDPDADAACIAEAAHAKA
jgi:predicted Rossmann fold nucleotide-binding protein DprA/Smf involved in DNA uptake